MVDNFFGSASLYAKLKKRGNTPLRGGEEIRVPHVYAGMTSSSYGRGDEFDTSTREFATVMRFNWKFSYAAVNLDVIDVDLNDSPAQVFALVDAAREPAELSLIDAMSDQTRQFIKGDPVKAIQVLGEATVMSKDEQSSVLRHLIEGGDLSRFGLMNAVTRTAEDVQSYDRATEIETLGGRILDLAANDWQRIAEAA